MRIVSMISSGGLNGAALHGVLVAKYLSERGHRVLLMTRPATWANSDAGLDGLERFETSFARTPRELIRVGQAVRDFGADVIHTHMSSAHSYGAAARLFGAVPVVATAQVAHFQLHWPLNHRVIAASREVADFNRRYNRVSPKAIRVIPNFIETDRLRPASVDERRAARAEFGFADDAFVVGSVGHLRDYKRPADLVRAFAYLAAARADARLLMIGTATGPAADETRAAVGQLGLGERVVVAGPRRDATSLLAAMDVFALASRREAGPLAILEAMARGLPVVATRVGMVPDFVLDGRTGLLAEVGDTAALGRHLTALATDDARRAGYARAGREHVERTYSVEAVAPQIEAVLAEAAALPQRPFFGFVARMFIRPPQGDGSGRPVGP